MLGVAIALLIAGWGYFIADRVVELVFLSATNFLFWWYIVFTSIIAVVYGLIFLISIICGTAFGAVCGGKLGAILGFLGGSALSTIGLAKLVVKRGLLIFGTHMLHNSVVIITDSSPEWNMSKVVFGAILLVIGLIMNKKNSGSSS